MTQNWTRRQFVRGLGFGMLGLSLPDVMRIQAVARPAGKAKSCIMIFLFGGPSHVDTWDMKPNASAEFRGEFKPIHTSAPGIQLCEHLPRTAQAAHRLAIVRSMTTSWRDQSNGEHHGDAYYMLTGRRPDQTFFAQGINRKPQPDDCPFVGSVVAFRRQANDLPGVVALPYRSGEDTGYTIPGQFGGMLGAACEPLWVRGQLDKPRELVVPQLAFPEEVSDQRMRERGALLPQIDAWQRRLEHTGGPLDAFATHQRKALALLTSEKSKRAFDLNRESPATRDRYGNDINGQSVLLARRLVEAGVPFVCVHWLGRKMGQGISWDTHSDNFGILKNILLPAFDACYSALLEDLAQRGLLDETLVVVTAEMGRNPKVGDVRTGGNGPPGRDHWVHCLSALLAGGGIRGGQTFGNSDKVGAYPVDRPARPENLAATIYAAFGLGHDDLMVQDRQGRPHSLVDEAAALPLFG